MDWQSAEPSQNNGSLTMWVNGSQVTSLTGINNSAYKIDGVRLGVAGSPPSATSGTLYFDAFESRRAGYIGEATAMQMSGPDGGRQTDPVSSFFINLYQAASRWAHKVRADLIAFQEGRNGTSQAGNNQSSANISPGVHILQPARFTSVLADSFNQAINYTYDPLNRLTAADYSDGSYFHYTYDAVGNITTQVACIGTGCTPVTTNYVYDDANRLISANGVEYVWDNNGNLLSDGVYTYTYDHANRLKTVTGAGLNASYTYNGLGDRVSQTVNGVTTYYTLDLAAGLTQVLSDGTNTYLYGVDRIGEYSVANGWHYYLSDGLGSVRQVIDSTGTELLAKSYEPYGEGLTSSGSATTNYGYAGEWTDSPTGLVYLRARYYQPQIGRFSSKDMWQGDYNKPMSYNRWIYGYGNPMILVDPSGQWPLLNFKTQATYLEIVKDKNGKPIGKTIKHEADTWTEAEKAASENAARLVGRAFADTINSNFSLLRNAYGGGCDPELKRYIYLPPISPVTAFLTVFKGAVVWEKRWKSATNVETGQPCNEGTCAYAETRGRNLIYVMKNATNTYAVEHPQWIVHELGHAFEWATVLRNNKGDLYRPGQTLLASDKYNDLLIRNYGNPNDPSNPDPYAGFAGGFNKWQFSVEKDPTPGEIFADMFVGWVYDSWRHNGRNLTYMAQKRVNFMDSTMPYLLRIALIH